MEEIILDERKISVNDYILYNFDIDTIIWIAFDSTQ